MAVRFLGKMSDPRLGSEQRQGDWMHFYIDETFQLPSDRKRSDFPPFYTLAATGYQEQDLSRIRKLLLDAEGGKPVHGSDLVRTETGRDRLEEIVRQVSPGSTAIVTSAAIPKKDRQGEATRAQLLRILIHYLLENFDVQKIVIEKRMFGVPSSRDAFVLRSIRRGHPQLSKSDLRQVPKKGEPMLWTADLLACSFRQKHKRDSHRFIELWDVDYLVP